MPKTSAGLLLYRWRDAQLQVLLVHPGGPFWAKKDLGAWSIPKGEFEPGEDPLAAAQRELAEETGLTVPGPFIPLGHVRQSGGKTVHAWAAETDCDPTKITSNSFSLEWPPRSGKMVQFPEIDRAEWFDVETAAAKLLPGQREFLLRLAQSVSRSSH